MTLEVGKSSYVFGRHSSFQLRYGWLTKGYDAIKEHSARDIFNSEDATVELGVGKNMVASIRYWLQAVGITDEKSEISDFGYLLLSDTGYDKYLEDDATLWLIHWQLATNQRLASSIYWLFNHFHKTSFTAEEALNHLKSFLLEQGIKFSEGTVKMDLQVTLRMYSPRRSSDTSVEEVLESPLSLLGLISYSDGRYNFKSAARETLPPAIVGYAVTQHFFCTDNKPVPVRNLMYGNHKPLGAVFRLTEESFIAKLEQLIVLCPKDYELREDAGIHQLYKLGKLTPADYLDKYYAARRR